MENTLQSCLLSDNRRQNRTGEEKSPTKSLLTRNGKTDVYKKGAANGSWCVRPSPATKARLRWAGRREEQRLHAGERGVGEPEGTASQGRGRGRGRCSQQLSDKHFAGHGEKERSARPPEVTSRLHGSSGPRTGEGPR